MTVQDRFPYPFGNDGESGVKGWVVPVDTLQKAISTQTAVEEGVWMAVRDKRTGEYVDPETYGLFIRFKNEQEESDGSVVYIWYGGSLPSEEDGDGWFDDFPPIPPGD